MGRAVTGPSIHGGFCVMVTAVHTSTSPTTTMAPKNCEEMRIGQRRTPVPASKTHPPFPCPRQQHPHPLPPRPSPSHSPSLLPTTCPPFAHHTATPHCSLWNAAPSIGSPEGRAKDGCHEMTLGGIQSGSCQAENAAGGRDMHLRLRGCLERRRLEDGGALHPSTVQSCPPPASSTQISKMVDANGRSEILILTVSTNHFNGSGREGGKSRRRKGSMVWSGKGGPPTMNREVILKACKEREGYTVREESSSPKILKKEGGGEGCSQSREAERERKRERERERERKKEREEKRMKRG
jgi:hypothetical protein